MDIDEVITELYGLPPADFVAARDAWAAAARKDKDADGARRIAALRRPSLAVWAMNLLARGRPEQAGRLLELGATLREATRTLDAAQLREASRRQHQIIAALAREAGVLAADEGRPVGAAVLTEVEGMLHTVLADPEVAERWAAGRLTEAPDPVVGFAFDAMPTTPPRAPDRTAATAKEKRKKKEEHEEEERRKREQEREQREQEREQREREEEARRRREQAEVEARTAEAAHAEAARRAQEADARVTDLEQRLAEARRDRAEARSAADTLRRRAEKARHAARRS
ncbi:hypothetical protein ACIGO8_10730 [Streptomyces sp. NPDC053493]|uniref:hypothetical protein n=1 Tax=Streptomyces sp. NPDC053493 TaxID=3365705 RepID=UPI0037D23AAE